MKYILIILAILGLIAYAWILGALPTDDEINKGEELKMEQLDSYFASRPKCWSYPEFTGKDDC